MEGVTEAAETGDAARRWDLAVLDWDAVQASQVCADM